MTLRLLQRRHRALRAAGHSTAKSASTCRISDVATFCEMRCQHPLLDRSLHRRALLPGPADQHMRSARVRCTRDPVELEVDPQLLAARLQLLLARRKAVDVTKSPQHVAATILALGRQVRIQLERQPGEFDRPIGTRCKRLLQPGKPDIAPWTYCVGIDLDLHVLCRHWATGVRVPDCGRSADRRGKMAKDNGAPYPGTALGMSARAGNGRSGQNVRSIGLQKKLIVASLLITLGLLAATGGLLWYHVVQDRVVLTRVAVEESADLMQREVSLRAGTVAGAAAALAAPVLMQRDRRELARRLQPLLDDPTLMALSVVDTEDRVLFTSRRSAPDAARQIGAAAAPVRAMLESIPGTPDAADSRRGARRTARTRGRRRRRSRSSVPGSPLHRPARCATC